MSSFLFEVYFGALALIVIVGMTFGALVDHRRRNRGVVWGLVMGLFVGQLVLNVYMFDAAPRAEQQALIAP